MAYETEFANIATRADELSDIMSGALVANAILAPLIYAENLPVGTLTKQWRKGGYVVAETLSESTAYTPSANSEYTETKVSATAAKTVQVIEYTIEAMRSGRRVEDLVAEQGKAVARATDAEILALFAFFTSNSAITASSVTTVNDLLDAVGALDIANALNQGGNAVAVLNKKSVTALKKELFNSGATPLTHKTMISLLEGVSNPAGYYGSLPGLDVYATSGLPTSGGDDVQLVYNPAIAFGGMYDPSPTYNQQFFGGAGFYWELSAYLFHKVVEWNDAAGVRVLSDT